MDATCEILRYVNLTLLGVNIYLLLRLRERNVRAQELVDSLKRSVMRSDTEDTP